MGGDLTQGTVKGDEVACPFHDWRWGGDGKCKQIPYARRVPLRARTQKYPTAIRNGQLLVWHDVEGSEPDLDILPPELPGVGTRASTPTGRGRSSRSSGSHCRELIDNVVDMAHFYYVHFSFPTSFRNVFEGHRATQYMESKGRPDKGGGYGDAGPVPQVRGHLLRTGVHDQLARRRLQGLRDRGHPDQLPHPDRPRLLHAPVRHHGPEARGHRRRRPRTTSRKKYAQMFGEGFLQDVHIWKNKVPVQNPLLCEEDGPVYQLRRWYEQYYVDKADITPEMVDRFEFEVDTTKANEYWQEEVAENLARRPRRTRPPSRRRRPRARTV